MKKIAIVTFVLASFLITVPMVHALGYQIQLRQDAYSYGVGGEFSATPSANFSWVLNYYDAKAKNIGYQNSFETFCIEYNEEFNPGNTWYNVKINDRAINGGIGPVGDPISKGTAWLYYQFAEGTLSQFDYNTDGLHATDRQSDSGLLQTAIWWLEDEHGLTYDSSNKFESLVVSTFGGQANAKADNNGFYPVAALNMTYPDGSLSQDQLTLVPEPCSILLLGLGLLGIGIIRRKQ